VPATSRPMSRVTTCPRPKPPPKPPQKPPQNAPPKPPPGHHGSHPGWRGRRIVEWPSGTAHASTCKPLKDVDQSGRFYIFRPAVHFRKTLLHSLPPTLLPSLGFLSPPFLRPHLLALDGLRHIPRRNALRQPLGNGRSPTPGSPMRQGCSWCAAPRIWVTRSSAADGPPRGPACPGVAQKGSINRGGTPHKEPQVWYFNVSEHMSLFQTPSSLEVETPPP